MTSMFNADTSLPYNHDLFESLIVKKKNKDGWGGDLLLSYYNHSEIRQALTKDFTLIFEQRGLEVIRIRSWVVLERTYAAEISGDRSHGSTKIIFGHCRLSVPLTFLWLPVSIRHHGWVARSLPLDCLTGPSGAVSQAKFPAPWKEVATSSQYEFASDGGEKFRMNSDYSLVDRCLTNLGASPKPNPYATCAYVRRQPGVIISRQRFRNKFISLCNLTRVISVFSHALESLFAREPKVRIRNLVSRYQSKLNLT
ncbi:hypothetical protein CSKR_103064 [Clonorchis sinensis]|uniref:Uncharacterized protein n=1 Tax=Clonorchis sinensis TaxID=79923 RepID=A0A419Q897_CLOSI|nr:hypothetical protein CSKR_103064 [Clonorchis sinensis]